jgi:hypothetical protein
MGRSAACGRSARPRSEIRGCFLENLVGALQLEVLSFELFQPRAFIGGQARTLPGIALGLPHPTTQRFRADAEFLADRPNRGPL